MAVIVKKKLQIGTTITEVKTYLPSGNLSKQNRIRADNLDIHLKIIVPKIADYVLETAPRRSELVKRHYLLGGKLREITQDKEMVLDADIASGDIWEAIWQYLPDSIKPPGSVDIETFSDYRHRRKDLLTLSYEISAYEWSQVEWLKRWEDWYVIASRPGLLRNERIVVYLGQVIASLPAYPDHKQFRKIIKTLTDDFPTRKFRDSSIDDHESIIELIRDVVESVVKHDSEY